MNTLIDDYQAAQRLIRKLESQIKDTFADICKKYGLTYVEAMSSVNYWYSTKDRRLYAILDGYLNGISLHTYKGGNLVTKDMDAFKKQLEIWYEEIYGNSQNKT